LALGRAALESQLAELDSRARAIATELGNAGDQDVAVLLTRLREVNNVDEAMVFTGTGRLIAFSTDRFGQLLPPPPPAAVLNQIRVTRSYAAAESDEAAPKRSDPGLRLRVVVPMGTPERDSTLGVNTESRWLQLLQPVSEKIARNASEVQAGFLDYQELALSRCGAAPLVRDHPHAGTDACRVCSHRGGPGALTSAGPSPVDVGSRHSRR